MFGLFEEKYFLGIDLGSFSIKAVEIKVEKGVAILMNFGIADIREEVVSGSAHMVSYEMKRQQYLVALLQKMQVHTKKAHVSIPGSSGLVAVVEFPKMKESELSEAVKFEAHKYVPADMDEVVLSWDVLQAGKESLQKSEKEKKNESVSLSDRVLLVAALKKDVDRSAGMIQRVGYSVSSMELEVFSLARALIGRGTSGTHLIVDIGFRVCNLILVHHGDVFVTRMVDVGGGDITKTIADGMNISFDRAEALKKQRDFFYQNEVPLSFPTIDILLNEIMRVQASFAEQIPGTHIESIILSGGGAMLPGLAKYFSQKTGIEVTKGDPWKQVQYNGGRIPSDSVEELGNTLAIALGLALRGVTISEA